MLVKFSWGGLINTSPRRGLYTVVIWLPWIGRHWLLHQHYNSMHRGHMWSPCDLVSWLTSLLTPARTKEIPIIDTLPIWFLKKMTRLWWNCLDCARWSSLCVAESRYLRKLLLFCPKVFLQGNRKEAGSMQRLQHPDQHLISSRNPDGLWGLPRFWITSWNVLSIITSCAIDACCTHSAWNL